MRSSTIRVFNLPSFYLELTTGGFFATPKGAHPLNFSCLNSLMLGTIALPERHTQ